MKRAEVYESITARIIKQLEERVLPWRRSWAYGAPRNYVSGKCYRGMNFLNLSLQEYPSPYYLTFLQTKQKNGYVNKGSKGMDIVYWEIKEYEHVIGAQVETIRFPLLKVSYVFNLSQTSLYYPDEKPAIVECEELLKSFREQPVITNNTRGCYYDLARDIISLPAITDFDSQEEYWASLWHEVGHWTGARQRVGRLTLYSAEDKAIEELVSELTASYLCALSGIDQAVIANQASYMDCWLREIKENPLALVSAAAMAQQAVDWLLPSSGCCQVNV